MTTQSPPVPAELQSPDPTLDRLYGLPPVEARQGKPPISRSYQLADDFAPTAPPELTPEPIAAPPAPVLVVEPVVAPNPTPEPPKEFTAKVDLGDGSGQQIFKADSQQGLIDKLVEAQKNATLRIRQLKEKAKAKPDTSKPAEPLNFAPHTLNEVEQAEINELWKANPAEAWRRTYEAMTGTKPDEVARTVHAGQLAEQKASAERAEAEFIADHLDDFDTTPDNGTKMYAFLAGCTRPVTEGGFNCKRCGKVHDLPYQTTKQNLEYAFETLTEQGAVFIKKIVQPEPIPVPVPAPTPVAVQPPAPVVPQIPAPVVQPAPPPPVMLSDRSGQRPPQQPSEGEVDVTGWQNLPLHEMKARIAQQLKRGSNPGR